MDKNETLLKVDKNKTLLKVDKNKTLLGREEKKSFKSIKIWYIVRKYNQVGYF